MIPVDAYDDLDRLSVRLQQAADGLDTAGDPSSSQWMENFAEDAYALEATIAARDAEIAAIKREACDSIHGLLSLVEALMPGLRHIAVQDYAAVNDEPLKARAFLEKHKEKTDERDPQPD